MSPAGRFITLEGIDGAGKSTHIAALSACLGQGGVETVVTREPGGTPLAERLRSLVLEQPMGALAETLLVFAARRDHLELVIEPALARGACVLCDRFTDATFAYQGAGRGVDEALLEELERQVQAGRRPDLTLWFDVPAAIAAARRSAARPADRFERQDSDFFERVRAGYEARRQRDPERIVRIDALGSAEEVWGRIERTLSGHRW